MSLRIILSVAILSLLMAQCKPSNVEMADTLDPDIVLVNFGSLDRQNIGLLIKKFDAAHPSVIGISAFFTGEKEESQDSALMDAFRIARNDVLPYSDNSESTRSHSHSKFTSLVSATGPNDYNSLFSEMIPVRSSGDRVEEMFPLQIIKLWKPGFQHSIQTNEKIDIKYTRSLDKYLVIDAIDFMEEKTDINFKNKIVLIGYLGPSDEDKFYTPIRSVEDYPANRPDTYGLVIHANAIRTILSYEVK